MSVRGGAAASGVGLPDVLIAGFEPFGGRARNRSLEIVRALERSGDDAGIVTAVLPVDFNTIEFALVQLAERRPAALLLMGESPRGGVAIEQVALNLIDTDRPDNSGHAPQARTIDALGPLALQATWNAHAVVNQLKAAGIVAKASFHAGTYACNAALYLALRLFPPGTPIGFMHVPQWRWPRGMRLAQLVRAAELCAENLRAGRIMPDDK